MRDSRRMKRMERNNGRITGLGLNLIPMMDVLTILVFFLLFHSFNGDIPEARIELPGSVTETRPRQTVAIVVSPEFVMVQGEAVVNTAKLFDDRIGTVPEVTARLQEIERKLAVMKTAMPEGGKEVTLLADKAIPFKVLKKIMSTCTASGYGRISLAVTQKASQG